MSKALQIKWSIYLLKWGEEERQRGLLLLSHFHLEEHTILTNLSAFITCFIVYIHKQRHYQCSSILYPPYAWLMIELQQPSIQLTVFCILKENPTPWFHLENNAGCQVLYILGLSCRLPCTRPFNHFQWAEDRCVSHQHLISRHQLST